MRFRLRRVKIGGETGPGLWLKVVRTSILCAVMAAGICGTLGVLSHCSAFQDGLSTWSQEGTQR